MARDTRQRMIGAATVLLRERGYDGTGFREVVARARAARGAIYHHFPAGKEQLGEEVATHVGSTLAEKVERLCADAPPAQAVAGLLDLAEATLVRGDSVPGCPIAAVALAADDPSGRLRAAADEVFRRWQDALARCLVDGGAHPAEARAYAALAVAAVEGAVLLCRARGDTTPFDDVRAGLLAQLPARAVDQKPES